MGGRCPGEWIRTALEYFSLEPLKIFWPAGRSRVVLRVHREPTLKQILMTNTLTALVAAATLVTAAAAVPTAADARCAGCEAPPGYVYDPAYAEPLPGSNCNWFRMPIYDVHGNMVSWRGRPVAFCSWLAGYRPWPLP